MGMIHCHFSLIREYHQSSHCIWWRMKCERDFQYDIYIFVHFHTTSAFQQNNKSSPYFQKKRPTTSSQRAVFLFENTQTTSTKNGWNNKTHSKTKRSENKTMVGWISSNISSHHIQPPTINENEFTPDPHDPHPRGTRQQEETSWRLTRWWFSNNEIWLLKKNATIPLKRVVFFQKSAV